MPPPLEPSYESISIAPLEPSYESSDESSAGSEIPHALPKGKTENLPTRLQDQETEDDEDDEELNEEGLYVVERIITHRFKGKHLYLEVKWKGYDDPADNTWEPEDNIIEGAEVALSKYYSNIGGRPEPPTPKTKKRNISLSANGTPESSNASKKRSKTTKSIDTPEISPPADFVIPEWLPAENENWENSVESIDTIERQGTTGKLMVYLNWKNGKKTRADIDQCYDKCPRKMLKFYESHLVFKVS